MLDRTTTALSAIAPLQAGVFTFVINGTTVTMSASDAVALSPAVALELSVDACARTFIVDEPEVNATAIPFFEGLSSFAQSAISPSVSDSARGSLSLLFRCLWNSSLELKPLFTGPRGGVRSLPNSVSVLSVEAIDCLLSDATFCIDREDLLLEWILGLGADYLSLLGRVQWSGLTADLVSAFERAALVEPQESVWAEVPRLMRLPVFSRPAGFSSLIVADFPALFAEFGGKRFTLLWRGACDGFLAKDFHGRCDR
jgi:hypothetical protein